MFSENKDFYPTPKKLAKKMVNKLKITKSGFRVLEPSAGAGDLLDILKEYNPYRINCFAIEKDNNLRAILGSKKYNLIDTDFLKYEGYERFDAILANFPFSDGEYHLDKALDLIYNGQIVCLINAETIKNPYSLKRQQVVQRLKDLGAKIQYLEEEFTTSETKRKTKVEVALIDVTIKNKLEDHFSDGLTKEKTHGISPEDIQRFDLVDSDSVSQLVSFYKDERDALVNQVMSFYKNYHVFKDVLGLVVYNDDNQEYSSEKSLTDIAQNKINSITSNLKGKYWARVIELKEVKSRLTSSKKEELLNLIGHYKSMDFNVHNIEAFIRNVVAKYPDMIKESIIELFDKMTSYSLRDYRWDKKDYSKNIHYFNAWKTNQGYKLNKKVILPFYNNYSGLNVCHSKENFLDDLDRVLAYFSGKRPDVYSTEIAKKEMDKGNTRKIETDNFILDFYQKGTVHVTFKDENVLRDFNLEVAKLRHWLPMDYDEKEYSEMTEQEKECVEKFEGSSTYSKKIRKFNFNINQQELKLIAE